MERPVRYLSHDDVRALMPPVDERLDLAERTMIALARGAELPPKIGVHPRPEGSFAHAMPAAAIDPAAPAADLLGMKWVAGFPDNHARGLAAIHATVILADPATGATRALLDGGPITAERTAAVSGIAIRRFARPAAPFPATRVALIGAGVQGHSHLAVLGHVLPGMHLAIHDRHPERAATLAATARGVTGIAAADVAETARAATHDADVVITAAAFTDPAHRQVMTGSWLRPDALVVAVDYATMCAADVARDAALFVVDELGQFLANRHAGQFDGYPDPGTTLGAAALVGLGRPPNGRVVVTHLGVGLADVVFADAIVRRAEAAGRGTLLPG
jgi:ornithine cyclodeaminase/alanine dehydrogenase-like protein (mu-crystallin family)